MLKIYLSLFIAVCLCMHSIAEDCSNGRYQKTIFTQVDVKKNIVYATKLQSDGRPINLRYDVYQPKGDTVAQRPVMLLIHGGAYLKLLDQNSPDIVLMCNHFAKMGYVTVSLDYRQEPNPLSLLSQEKMVKAVGRALIDTKDAVDHFMLTYQNGNPYRIDTSRAFIGGVSAGGVSALFITFLDSLAMLPANFQEWIIESNGIEADSILKHKFDLVKPKAAISISGAVSDLSWIRNVGIDLFLCHGSADEIVPYRTAKPFNIPDLPLLSGSKDIYPLALNAGIRTFFEDWEGRGHVPFMNLDFGSIITLQLINQKILDTTQANIARFLYPLVNCNNIVSSIKQNKIADLKLFPNPSVGTFYMELPKRTDAKNAILEMFDLTGKKVLEKTIEVQQDVIKLEEKLPAAQYFIKLSYAKNDNIEYYTSNILIIN
ncbi:MAG: T9SS type A sorting domain-containing protein [Sphingobacteriales bacterium]|nr:MAG: T9SS type A sorting domain-containing protein [Sphingobacteriales bacterium]